MYLMANTLITCYSTTVGGDGVSNVQCRPDPTPDQTAKPSRNASAGHVHQPSLL